MNEKERESTGVRAVRCDGLAAFQGPLCSPRAGAGICANVYVCLCIYHSFTCARECLCARIYTPHSQMERVSTSAMTSG